MNISKELITPEIAKKYLGTNLNNRRIKEPVVLRYAADIKAGRWKEDTAEFIKILKNGEVGDGQHRLHAVIKSNTPTWFHVASGIEVNVMDVLDTGSVRSSSDVFKISGIKNECVIPSMISFYHLLNTGMSNTNQINSRLTNAMILEEYYKNAEYWQSVCRTSVSHYHSFNRILNPSQIGGFLSHFTVIDKIHAAEFMTQLCTGANVTNTTILLLRNTLTKDRMSIKKIPIDVKNVYIIKTWNSFRSPSKSALKILKFDKNAEKFPIAI